MALWFDVHINEDTIGSLVIIRMHEEIPADGLCQYQVTWGTRTGSLQFDIQHYRNDGALKLVAIAIDEILRQGEYEIPIQGTDL